MSAEAIEAILAAGSVSENSAQLEVHEGMNHLCITLVGTPDPQGAGGFAMFAHVHMPM